MKVIILYGNILGLGIVRTLGRNNIKSVVIYNDKEELARFSKYCIRKLKCPPFNEHENVVKFLLDHKEFHGNLIIPSNDEQIKILSDYRDELSKYYIINLPPKKIVNILLDKEKTHRIAKKAGVDFPKTYTETPKKFPVMIKPKIRHEFYHVFRKKLFVVNSKKEYVEKVSLCRQHNIEILVHEVISGPDTNLFSYNFYVKNDKIIKGIVQQKLRQAPPLYGVGRVTKISKNKEIKKLSEKFIKHLPGFVGPGHIEFKYDPIEKKYKMLEMNGRIILQGDLFSHSGVDLTLTYFNDSLNLPIRKNNSVSEEFYWINLYNDVYYSIFHNEGYKDYLKPYFKKHYFAIESIMDPLPMIYFWFQKLLAIPNFILKKKHNMSHY